MNAYYERAFDLLRCDAVRRSFDINQEDRPNPRALRPQHSRAERAIGPAAGRRRRAVRQRVRQSPQRPGQLGHARQQLRPVERSIAAALRHGVLGAGRRSGDPRAVGLDAGHHAGRIWPHAQDQFPRGPRPLARLLQRGDGRRRSDRRGPVRLERQDRGLSGPEPGLAGRPGSHDFLAFWARSTDRAARRKRTPIHAWPPASRFTSCSLSDRFNGPSFRHFSPGKVF